MAGSGSTETTPRAALADERRSEGNLPFMKGFTQGVHTRKAVLLGCPFNNSGLGD